MQPLQSQHEQHGSPSTRNRVQARLASVAPKLVGPAVFAIGCGAWALMPLDKTAPAWWIGASFFALSGLFLSLLAHRTDPARRAHAAPLPPSQADLNGRRLDDPDVVVPMIGALLAFRFRAINEWQLAKALAVQRKQRRSKQSLGRILLDMGLVTQPQLRQALDYQKEYERRKRASLREAASGSPKSGTTHSAGRV